MSDKKQIKISEVLEMLANGKNRVQIGEEYGITPREVKMLFEHPKLKGVRASRKKEVSFVIEDDITEGGDKPEQKPDLEEASNTNFE